MKIFRPFFAMLLALAAALSFAANVNHNYDLKNLLWKLSFSMEKGTIQGDATNTLTLTEDSSTVELSCSELDVRKVTVNGAPAAFQTKDDKLIVTLPAPGKAGDTYAIRALYDGAPVNGFYFVPDSRAYPSKTGMVYTQGEGEDNHYWVPTYDYPDDKATTECYVEVPKDWTAISNGALMGVENKGATKVFHWKMDQPYSTYLISLVAGKYVKGHDTWHGIPIDYYVPPGLERQGRLAFGDTPKMVDCFSRLTGVPYPYAKFAQEVVSDFMFGGMENVTCVTQTIRTLHNADAEPVRTSTYLVAHELAHHWFGDLITCQTWEHTWLNEGFATTLPLFYDRETSGQDVFDLGRYQNMEGAVNTIGSRGRKDVGGAVGGLTTVTMGSAYDGGCSRILLLMHTLGEETFWKGIHAFLEQYKFQPATTQEFFDVMSKESGADLNPFMKQWFYTAATPSLTVRRSGGKLVVDQFSPYYSMELPVWIWDKGQWVKKSMRLEGAESTMDLGDLDEKPLLVDPEAWIPMEIHYDLGETAQDVYAVYHHAPNVAAKARIVSELFDSIPVKDRVAIGHGEDFYGLLALMAGHMGQEGQGYLLELTHHADQRVVMAAVSALAGLPADPTVTQRLSQIAKTDPNELVRERANQAVLSWTTDGALADKAWKTHAFDDGYRSQALQWWGTHLPDYARKVCLDFLRKPDSEPVRVTAIQVLGQVKEAPGQHQVFDALVKVARETSINARTAAINALGQLGNKAAIPILKPMTEHGFGGVRGAAKSAVAALGG